MHYVKKDHNITIVRSINKFKTIEESKIKLDAIFLYRTVAYSGQVLDSSQFLLLPQLPEKTKLALKVVKIDSEIIISLH